MSMLRSPVPPPSPLDHHHHHHSISHVCMRFQWVAGLAMIGGGLLWHASHRSRKGQTEELLFTCTYFSDRQQTEGISKSPFRLQICPRDGAHRGQECWWYLRCVCWVYSGSGGGQVSTGEFGSTGAGKAWEERQGVESIVRETMQKIARKTCTGDRWVKNRYNYVGIVRCGRKVIKKREK